MNEIIVFLGSYETNETQIENTESSPTLDNSNIAEEYADEVHKIPTIESIDPLNKIKEEPSTQATDNLAIVIPAENDVNSDHNEEIDNKDNQIPMPFAYLRKSLWKLTIPKQMIKQKRKRKNSN